MLIDPNNGTSTTLTLSTLTAPTAAGSSLTLGKAVTANTGNVAISSTTDKDATGIYGGRIVFADGTANTGYDWATTASGVAPFTLSSYGGYSALDLTAGSDTLNSKVTASQFLGGDRVTNTLKIEDPAAIQNLDLGANLLTLTGGGLLVTGTNGTTISGTSGATRLMGSASGDLVISQYNSGGLNISAVIGNNGGATALTKTGTAPLTLSGSNTFTGGLFINSGNLVLGDPGALNSTPGSENAVTFAATDIKILSLGGNSVVVRSLSVIGNNPGVTILENASATPATLTIGNSANAASTFNGVIRDGSGAGALTLKKSGTGSLNLNATNTFTGGVILNGGTVGFQSAGALNNNAITVTANTVMNPATQTNTAGITLNNSSILSIGTNTGTFATSGAVTGDGGITLSQLGQGATRLNFTSTANTFTGPVKFAVTPNAGQHGELTVNSFADSSSPGAGNITFGFAGTGTNNHTFIYGSGAIAPLTLTNRQFEVGGTHVRSIIDNSSTRAMTINSNLLYSGSGAKTLTLQGGGTGLSTFAGNLVDGGGANTVQIIKTGSGTWNLGGTNTYLGGTTLTTGTLQFTKLVAMPATGVVAAANNTTLAINVGGTGEWTTGTSGNGTIGGLLGGLGGQTGGTVTYAGTSSVAFDTSNASPATQTYGGNISNVGTTLGIKKLGANTLELTGTNAYTGATTVSGGTLLVNSPGSLNSSSSVTVGTGSGGTLGGDGTINGSVSLAADGSLSPGAAALPGLLTIGGGLNISAPANGGTGKLVFQLDALANTSEKVTVTGTLTIGIGALGFSDFVFTNLGGLEVTGGTPYKLITSSGITALNTLDPANLTGTLPGGLTGTLQLNGGDLELAVTSGGGSAYDTWATAKGLTGLPGFEKGKTADPDKDGQDNLSEFAFDGDPLSGANDGKVVGKVATVGADQFMTLTLPVRGTAPTPTFSNDGGDQLSALIDGIYYRIEGSSDLAAFANTITEVTSGEEVTIQSGLPTLSTGWSYRTFRDSGTVPTVPKTFLRAKISETP